MELRVKNHVHTWSAVHHSFIKPSFLACEIWQLSQQGSGFFNIEVCSPKLPLQENRSKSFLDTIFGLKVMLDSLSITIDKPSISHSR